MPNLTLWSDHILRRNRMSPIFIKTTFGSINKTNNHDTNDNSYFLSAYNVAGTLNVYTNYPHFLLTALCGIL